MMKKSAALMALTGLLVAAGCATSDYYGASDDAQYSTPSWGTSSGMDVTPYGLGNPEAEGMTPSAGQDHGNAPQMPPTESDKHNAVPDFGTQHR